MLYIYINIPIYIQMMAFDESEYFFFRLPKEYYDDIIIPIIRKYYRSTAIYLSWSDLTRCTYIYI